MSNAGSLCLLLVATILPAQENPERWYVAVDGDDAGAGTAAAPFGTIERAQRAVRASIAAGLKRPVRVILGGGRYELSAPLRFTSADSGTEKFAVTYAAARGATCVISGGRRLTGLRGMDAGAWTAAMPEVAAGQWFFRQLTVDGKRARRARWPNRLGELRVRTVADGVRRFTFDRPLPKGLGKLSAQSTELVVFQNWSITRGLVESAVTENVATRTPMGWIGHGPATTASPGKPAMLEHARGFMDEPGEWFLDREKGELLYLPRPAEEKQSACVVAPKLERLLIACGTRERPIVNLCFERIRFEDAGYPLPEVGYNEIQAAHHGTTLGAKTWPQPVAVEFSYTRGCRIDGCRFAHLGASGIGLGPGSRGTEIRGCEIVDVGGNGVMIGWRGRGVVGGGRAGDLDADWTDRDDVPRDNVIAGCHITRCGAESHGGVGIFVAFATKTRIVGNVIHDLPYTGVSLGYRWNSQPTSQSHCLVERNHIYDITKLLADGGGIYTLGLQPGTVLRENYIHDVHRSAFAHGGAPNNGMFLDQGSKGLVIERNVVHETSGKPVRFNQTKRAWQTWQGNWFGEDAAKTSAAHRIVASVPRLD